jgi:hypothetical protein
MGLIWDMCLQRGHRRTNRLCLQAWAGAAPKLFERSPTSASPRLTLQHRFHTDSDSSRFLVRGQPFPKFHCFSHLFDTPAKTSCLTLTGHSFLFYFLRHIFLGRFQSEHHAADEFQHQSDDARPR